MTKKDATKMKRKELCSHLFKKKYSKEFYDSPLNNTRNSCYIDATLMAILHPIVTMGESNFWYNHIFKEVEQVESNNNNDQINQIRAELKNIVLKIKTSFRGNGGIEQLLDSFVILFNFLYILTTKRFKRLLH
jgi:monomeric isocitrate dehydrogenase